MLRKRRLYWLTLQHSAGNRLTALIQSARAENTDGGENLGAPAASVYEGHSGEIFDTLSIYFFVGKCSSTVGRCTQNLNYRPPQLPDIEAITG